MSTCNIKIIDHIKLKHVAMGEVAEKLSMDDIKAESTRLSHQDFEVN